MQFTLIGIIWCFLLAIGLLVQWKYLITLLAISSVLQASALLNLGDSGLSLFLATELTIILKSIMWFPKTLKLQKKFMICLTIFIVYSVSISLFMSFSKYSLSRYSMTNKIVLVLIHYITAFMLSRNIIHINGIEIYKIHLISLVVVALSGYVVFFLYRYSGFIPQYIEDIFYNNCGYKMMGYSRLKGTFTEASYCGAYLGASLWALASLKSKQVEKYKILFFIFITPAILLNLSSTGLATFSIGLLIFIFLNIDFNTLKKIVFLGIIILLVLVGLDFLDINEIYANLWGKVKSVSWEVRNNMNMVAMQNFIRTYGLGAGLASERGSSLIISLLGTVGVIGCVSYIASFFYLIKDWNVKSGDITSLLKIQLLLLIVAQTISCPDINYFPTWNCIFEIIIVKNMEVRSR